MGITAHGHGIHGYRLAQDGVQGRIWDEYTGTTSIFPFVVALGIQHHRVLSSLGYDICSSYTSIYTPISLLDAHIDPSSPCLPLVSKDAEAF